MHPVYGVQDWDRAEGAIEWPRMIRALGEVSKSHVHLGGMSSSWCRSNAQA